jgi:hypothetical protein
MSISALGPIQPPIKRASDLLCSMSVHYIIQKINHQQMHKEFFFVNYTTLLHVSTLLGHLQGETFGFRYTTLHYTVERECAVDCVLRRLWRRELLVVSACTAVPSVTTTESFSLKMIQQGRNM